MNITSVFLFFKKLYYSKQSLIFMSFILSLITTISIDKWIEDFGNRINEINGYVPFTIYLIIVALAFLLITADFFTGVIVSRKVRKEELKSKKMETTIGKYLGLALYSPIAMVVIIFISSNYFILAVFYMPTILTALKEYVSIGENLEKLNGKMPYMFSLINKIFDILENKFFKTIEDYQFINGNNIDDDEIYKS